MIKGVLFFFLLVAACYIPAQAQKNAGNITTSSSSNKYKHLRISLVTCGPGNESYETFGHSGIRIIDSNESGTRRDLVYNYGTVDFFDGSYLHKFLKGKMTTFLEAAPYPLFEKIYTDESRGMTELVFLLNDQQKENMLRYLERNELIENKYSEFDILYNNCTTQARDAIIQSLGSNLILGEVISRNASHTFRDGSDEYLAHKHWRKVLMNIFFGRMMDKITDNTEAMQIPSYLAKGISGATLNGKKLCDKMIIINSDKQTTYSRVNSAFLSTLIFAIITIISLSVTRLHAIGNILSTFILTATGLLGCCILYAWFFTGQPEFKDNVNILWALPTNLLLPFCGTKIKMGCGIVATCLVIAFLIADFMKIQVMPLLEIGPWLATLLFIYCKITFATYRKGSLK